MQGAAFEGSDTRASASALTAHEGYSVFDCGLSFSAWNHASPGRCAHLMHTGHFAPEMREGRGTLLGVSALPIPTGGGRTAIFTPSEGGEAA